MSRSRSEVQLVVQRADPFRAATYCETHASPRVFRGSSKRSASRCASSSARALAAPGPSTGTSRPREQRAHDLVVVILVGRPGRRGERALLAQDRPVQRLQLRAGLDAELVDERAARVLVRRERLGLAAGAVEREHQLRRAAARAADAADERLQLADELGRAAPSSSSASIRSSSAAEPQLLEPPRSRACANGS